jgi:hypothetical protein
MRSVERKGAATVAAPARKTFRFEWKDGTEPGSFRATLATFLVVDKDGDVTFPGAFPAGKEIPISAYGHASWMGALPVGKGVIGADDKIAWVDGKFFTDTVAGADTYKTVKQLGKLGEWSYGYDPTKELGPTDSAMAEYPGAQRGLVKLEVYEASPVLLGAGVGTGTTAIKSRLRLIKQKVKASADPETLAVIAQVDFLIDEADELVDTLMDDFGIPDPDEAAEGEPEEPVEAGGASGTADEETIAAIAQLDALMDQADEIVDTLMDTFGIPDPDEDEAAEPEETTAGKSAARFADDATHVLADVQAFAGRAKAVKRLREKEGRVLSEANRARLNSLADSLDTVLADVRTLLAETDPGKSASLGSLIAQLESDPRITGAGYAQI